MRVFKLGGKLFSRKQNADGVWQRAVLLPLPTPAWRARQDGIYTPLFVPNPFRQPEQIKAAQDKVLEGFHFDVSADGKAVSLDPLERGHACLKHAQDKNNLRSAREFAWQTSALADSAGRRRLLSAGPHGHALRHSLP